jgi:hypothetical protein
VPVRELCQWIQETGLSRALAGAVWAYPVIGAVHVLGLALFGGAVLIADLRTLGFAQISERPRYWTWVGLVVMVFTGVLLFWSGPVRYYDSVFFRIKLLLLLGVALNAWLAGSRRLGAWVSLALWMGIVFASRGIAFW